MTKVIADIYIDTGCEVSPSCLNCPLPVCKYDAPAQYGLLRRQQRDQEKITVMQREGLTMKAAAEQFGITERTMFRILRRNKEEAVAGTIDIPHN